MPRTQIAARFHEAGIEIAFPQREVRIHMADQVDAIQLPGERRPQRA